MKNFKRLLASFVTLITLLVISPISAHAEWKQSGNSWWYTQGGSYTTGWTQIDGKWYNFDSNGYMKTGWINSNRNWFYTYGDGTMAHDTTIDGSYLNSAGTWTTNIPTVTTAYTGGNKSGSTTSAVGDAQSQTVYVSRQGICHTSPIAHGMKYYTAMSRADAESKGYRACKICY